MFMRKKLSILVVVLSIFFILNGCSQHNYVEYILVEDSLSVISGSELSGDEVDKSKIRLFYDEDNDAIKFKFLEEEYLGTLEFSSTTKNSVNVYRIDWDKKPILVKDYDVSYTLMSYSSETGTIIMMHNMEDTLAYTLYFLRNE